jgi:hypothetical protein
MICSLLLTLPLYGCDYGDRNRDPVANNDAAITAREVPVTINALANDFDPDGDPVQLVTWTQGSHGEVIRDSEGTLTYTPDEGFDGGDSFTYTIDEEHGDHEHEHGEKVTLGFIRQADGSTSTFTVPGSSNTFLGGLNNRGQIVGGFTEEEAPVQPFLRKPDGTVFRFSIPHATQARFSGINNQHVISGFSLDEAGVRQALVLTPIQPAPNTLFRDTPADGEDHDHDHAH